VQTFGEGAKITNKYDPELSDAASYAPGRHCLCTHQMTALFCVKWRHGHHL